MNFEDYKPLAEDGSEQFIPESIWDDLLDEMEVEEFFG